MKALDILQITPVFPPHIGGLEKCAYNLSKHLVKLGHKVIVYTTELPQSKPFEIMEGIVVHRVPTLLNMLNVPVAFYFDVLKEDADILHFHIPPPTGALSSILLRKIKQKPVVLTYHADTIGNGFIQRVMAKLYNIVQNEIILKNVTMITVPSSLYRMKLIGQGVDADRIEVISNGIEPFRFSTNPEATHLREKYGLQDRKIVLFVGRLENSKGVKYLIETIPQLAEEIDDIKIIMVGDGRLRRELGGLAHDLGVEDNILFTGYLIGEELNTMYDVADVFVLPSLYEVFPLALLEAMAHGKPAVVTDIAGTRELVRDGHNGLLVEPGSSRKLASAITRLLQDNKLAGKIGEKGRQTSISFSWERVASEMVHVYEKAMETDAIN